MNWREDVYQLAVQTVREALPDLRYIDLQRGQFRQTQQSRPVPLPCVLFEYDNIKFEEQLPELRYGNGVLSIYYCCRANSGTFEGSGTIDYTFAEFEALDTLTEALCYLHGENDLCDTQAKVSEKIAQQDGQRIIYQMDFELNVKEDYRKTNSKQLSVEIIKK